MINVTDIIERPRRNRKTPAIRSLLEETHLKASDLIAPMFVKEGHDSRDIIPSMPNVYRLTIDQLINETEILFELGIRAIDLFPVISKDNKDLSGSHALQKNNILFKAVKTLKKEIPEMCVMVDIALDPYTDHGHDGVLDHEGYVENDPTVELLCRLSVLAAEAGVDIVAPSDMMDGRVKFIRTELDRNGFQNVGILSYAAKYASSLYGPFRDILQSELKSGDKKSYQLNPANSREALREAALDEIEGADMLLVKPALFYLDIISKIKENTNLPVGAYHVSGEYAMVLAAAKEGWLDADKVLRESMLSIKRAGADFIFTYAAGHIAELLKREARC